MLCKFNLTTGTFPSFCQKSLAIFDPTKPKKISIWAKQQCFILLQNFLLLLTSLNIATSPMGGFQEKKVIEYLENNGLIPANYYNLAVSFSAGYPLNNEL